MKEEKAIAFLFWLQQAMKRGETKAKRVATISVEKRGEERATKRESFFYLHFEMGGCFPVSERKESDVRHF